MLSIRKQLALKIKLERIFTPEVRRIFNSMAKDFRIRVASQGVPPQTAQYKPVWETLLKNHYKRVQKGFIGSVKQVVADDDILSVYLDWNNDKAPKAADWIVQTTQANMNEAIQLALDQAAEEFQIALSNRELSVNATRLLKRKLRNRIDRIVNSETQKAAEAAKFIEAELHSGLKPRTLGGGLQQTDTMKKWTTVGDRRVRPAHKVADGQMRKLTEPYLVAGEYLMHPGDDSLGASISNLANCRCISTYSFY